MYIANTFHYFFPRFTQREKKQEKKMGQNMFATKFVVACRLYSTFTEIEKSHSFWVREKDKALHFGI